LFAPTAVGENFRLIKQLAPTAKLFPHVPSLAKENAPESFQAGEVSRTALPVFFSVMSTLELVVPTTTLPKFTELCDKLILAAACASVGDAAAPKVAKVVSKTAACSLKTVFKRFT